ncbi:hypothetical protein SDRG_02557 [Saprolegnia diclina VS20]|uniref:Protein YIF1 n=1 Tax=Saprolegnia diclina (strain VS20) TaxID=1156394 RepID=T0QYY1_SAPDV|nr:hypothetical protein SDRG_02557 [Saprolegnia diclina VS20]EQC39901.1 hypothetical protein SDRG_02557 [Saprolegnia diclina VS20]|eukprot:XP_008606375.1 hypothetical protein SDRG_02557 [Saprolegnia diclina VS20]
MAQPVPFRNPSAPYQPRRAGFNPQYQAPAANDFFDGSAHTGSNNGSGNGYPDQRQAYNRGHVAPQEPSYGQPQGMMGQPQGMMGQPQGMMGQPQGMMGQPQGMMGQPQGMMGQSAPPMGAFLGQAMGSGSPEELLNNPMAGYMMSQGVGFMENKISSFVPGAKGAFGSVKYYFTVNNAYVVTRLKMLLVPFLHSNWRRRTEPSDSTGEITYKPPTDDVNAPDLYIPLMSFATYILLVGFIKGTSGQFNPDVIGDVGMYCVMLQCLEIAVMKACLHVLNSSISFLDLVAFTGYKYVPLVLNTVVRMLLGSMAYYIALLYTGLTTTYFMLQCLKGSVPEPSYESRRFRTYMLLGLSAAQMLLIWWNSYTGEIQA